MKPCQLRDPAALKSTPHLTARAPSTPAAMILAPERRQTLAARRGRADSGWGSIMDWDTLVYETRSLMESASLARGHPVPRVSDAKIRRLLERELAGSRDPMAVALLEARWDEDKHPRGQPGNAGEFGPGGGGGAKKGAPAAQGKIKPPAPIPSPRKIKPPAPVPSPGRTRAPAGGRSPAGAGAKSSGDLAPGKGVPARPPRQTPEAAPDEKTGESHLAKTNAGRTRSKVGTENERRLARALGEGRRALPDSEPMDILYTDPDGLEHGYEVKTFLTNQEGRIDMGAAKKARKDAWAQGKLIGIKDTGSRPDPDFDPDKGRRVHVVVLDQREAYFDAVEGATDFDKRSLISASSSVYYARHPRPWGIGEMIRCDDLEALKTLTVLPEEQYRKVYEKYAGRSWPSGAAHPVVSKIVTGETPAQVRHLHALHAERLDHAEQVLARREARLPVARAAARQARAEYRAAAAAGEDSFAAGHALAKAERTADDYTQARKALAASRARLEVRRHKFDVTAAKVARLDDKDKP